MKFANLFFLHQLVSRDSQISISLLGEIVQAYVTVQSDVPHFYVDAALWTERSLYNEYIILVR